jgi:hypothetical protein
MKMTRPNDRLLKNGPINSWACYDIVKLKQILNEKLKSNPEKVTARSPQPNPENKVQTLNKL